MSFLNGFGSLLGGATQEAAKIKQERFAKEQADVNLVTSMLQHIIENPNIVDPTIKAHAQHAWRDVVMEHLFPDQFKKDKKNPVMKMVDQFVGQQNTGPAMAGAMEQLGVGRGNATTQVGAAQPPGGGSGMPPPPWPAALGADPGSMVGSASSAPSAGGPPSPASAGVAPMQIPNVEGFASPADIAHTNAMNEGRDRITLEKEATASKLNQIFQHPEFKAMIDGLDPEQKSQAIAGLFGTNFTPQPTPGTASVYDAALGKMVLKQVFPNGTTRTVTTSDLPPTENEKTLRADATHLFEDAKANPKSPYAKLPSVDAVYDKLVLDEYAQKKALADSLISQRNYYRSVQSMRLPPYEKLLYDKGNALYEKARETAQKEIDAWTKNGAKYEQAGPELRTYLTAPGKKPDLQALTAHYAEELAAAQGLKIDEVNKILSSVNEAAQKYVRDSQDVPVQ